jgi:uncharacterized alkaline shock family protein YloU
MAEQRGVISIAPAVLATVAAYAALAVPGVASLSRRPAMRMDRLLRRTAVSDGVAVEVVDDSAKIDLFLIYDRTVDMLETSRRVQSEVMRAVQETVGMAVGEINVHVTDVVVEIPDADAL